MQREVALPPSFVQALRRILSVLPLAALLGGTPAMAENPFGVMLWPAAGQDTPLLVARAAALGVAWFRPPAVFVDRWRPGAPCPACAALARSGLKVALTVRNGGEAATRRPSEPPADLAAYEHSLAAIVEAWHPAILVVEHEENNPASYNATAAAYEDQLRAACAVAHGHGAACTNGGLTSDAAAGLAWLALLDEGKTERACDFARRVYSTEDDPDAGGALCSYTSRAAVPPEVRTRLLGNAEALLPVYRRAPLDVLNFHWYGHDASALAETAAVLARLTGKPVMSNEIGQRPWDAAPSHVRALLRGAFAAGVSPAIWYSVDGPGSVSLFNEDGSLRPAGREFAHQMSGRK